VKRRLPSIGCLVGAIAIATIGLTPVPAAADAPRDQGWWTVTNPFPAPPDVPARGLLVQGGGGGAPTAVAAILYELDPGTTVGNLTLTVAPNSLTTRAATLQLCPLIQPITHAEQGGPMSDVPPYNCAHKVTAAPASDGKSYQFAASELLSDRLLAVAILPTGPVDRVVLSAPDANSLATQQTSVDTTPPAADTGTTVAPPDLALPGGGLLASPPVASPPGLDTALPGVSTGVPYVASPAGPKTAAGRSNVGGAFVPVVSSSPEAATPLLVLLFVAAGLGGAALWLYAGRQREDTAVSG
jgi:F0F1-type ATP synthase membrane subunit c/vacuolar-type H+-ATPase subunit K